MISYFERAARERRLRADTFDALERFLDAGTHDDEAAEKGLDDLSDAYIELKALRRNPGAPLDPGTVRLVRSLSRHLRQQDVADLLGVAQSLVSRIVRRESHADVPD